MSAVPPFRLLPFSCLRLPFGLTISYNSHDYLRCGRVAVLNPSGALSLLRSPHMSSSSPICTSQCDHSTIMAHQARTHIFVRHRSEALTLESQVRRARPRASPRPASRTTFRTRATGAARRPPFSSTPAASLMAFTSAFVALNFAHPVPTLQSVQCRWPRLPWHYRAGG